MTAHDDGTDLPRDVTPYGGRRYAHDGLDAEFKDAFGSIGRSALSLFVLSTTENFPFVMCERAG